MFSVLGPSLPVQPMLSAPTEHHESTSPHGGSPLAESKPGDADRLPSNLPSILDMRLHEWIQKLTNPHGGAFPNGISPKQMETLAHAQWAAAIRAGRNVRPSWRGSNHLSALLSNEVRAGRLLRLQKACYIGCDPRVQRAMTQNRASLAHAIMCAACRNQIVEGQGVSLKCKACCIHVHAECAYNQRRIPMALLSGSKQWLQSWYCLNCKRCNICGGADKKEGLLCRNCDSMEHVRCQRSFDADLSYRFWSCSICVKANECQTLFQTLIHAPQRVATEQRSIPVLTMPTPDNSHTGSSPVDYKPSPTDDKPAAAQNGHDAQIFNLQSALSHSALCQRSPFFTEAPPGQNPLLTLEDKLNRKFLGLPARLADKEPENSPINGNQDASPQNSPVQVMTPIPDTTIAASVKTWSTDQVATFFRELGYPESATALKREEIDGAALLLMERADIFMRLGLKMGPALKTYKAIRRLQKAFSRMKMKTNGPPTDDN